MQTYEQALEGRRSDSKTKIVTHTVQALNNITVYVLTHVYVLHRPAGKTLTLG